MAQGDLTIFEEYAEMVGEKVFNLASDSLYMLLIDNNIVLCPFNPAFRMTMEKKFNVICFVRFQKIDHGKFALVLFPDNFPHDICI